MRLGTKLTLGCCVLTLATVTLFAQVRSGELFRLNDGPEVLACASDPGASAGTAAPTGSVALCTDGTGPWIKFDTGDTDWALPAGTGAPTDATYLTQTANGSLSAEQAMGALGTGLVSNTTTTGVQSIYAGDSCSEGDFVEAIAADGSVTCDTPAGGGSGGADFTNAGTCQGSVTGNPGQTCRDTSNGVLEIKLAGTGNTGWYRMLAPPGPGAGFRRNWTLTPRAGSTTLVGEGINDALGAGGTHTFVHEGNRSYHYVTTSGSNNGFITNWSGTQDWVWDYDFEIVWHVKSDPSDVATSRYVLGVSGSDWTSDAPTARTIGFRYSTTASDTGWVGFSADGTTASVTSALNTMAADTVYVLRLRKVGTTLYFSVDNGAETSKTTNVPTGTTTAYLQTYISAFAGTKGLKTAYISGFIGGQ